MLTVCLWSQRWERGGCVSGSSQEDLPEHSGRQSGSERGRVWRAAQTVSAAGRPAHQRTTAAEGGLWLLMTFILHPRTTTILLLRHHTHARGLGLYQRAAGTADGRITATCAHFLLLSLSSSVHPLSLVSVFLRSHPHLPLTAPLLITSHASVQLLFIDWFYSSTMWHHRNKTHTEGSGQTWHGFIIMLLLHGLC